MDLFVITSTLEIQFGLAKDRVPERHADYPQSREDRFAQTAVKFKAPAVDTYTPAKAQADYSNG